MQITPEMVEGAIKLAVLAVEYARELAKARGMRDDEIEAAWNAAKAKNEKTLGDYIGEFGGDEDSDPEPAFRVVSAPWFDLTNPYGTSWPSLDLVPRDKFPPESSIFRTGPAYTDRAPFYFVPISILNPALAYLDPQHAGLT